MQCFAFIYLIYSTTKDMQKRMKRELLLFSSINAQAAEALKSGGGGGGRRPLKRALATTDCIYVPKPSVLLLLQYFNPCKYFSRYTSSFLTHAQFSIKSMSIPKFTFIYVRRYGLPLVGIKCVTEHAHAS